MHYVYPTYNWVYYPLVMMMMMMMMIPGLM